MTAQILAFPDRLAPPPALQPRGHALFLDFDGVLAPIAQTPDAVRVDARRTSVLRRLQSGFDGRLAIVSGRPLDEVAALTEDVVPALAGVHGLERRFPSRQVWRHPPDPDVAEARTVLQALVQAQPRLRVEDKGVGVALHYRECPEACEAVREVVRRLEAATDLVMQEGDMVAELRTAGADKGLAVDALMAEPPFIGARPIFVGDDLTDEDGFAAVAAAGGYGVIVGPTRRETLADYRLDDVEAVLAWLEAATQEVRA